MSITNSDVVLIAQSGPQDIEAHSNAAFHDVLCASHPDNDSHDADSENGRSAQCVSKQNAAQTDVASHIGIHAVLQHDDSDDACDGWEVTGILAERSVLAGGENEVLVVWKPTWIPLSQVKEGTILAEWKKTPKYVPPSGHYVKLPGDHGSSIHADVVLLQEWKKNGRWAAVRPRTPSPPKRSKFHKRQDK
jgi:hypothetical protein